MNIWYEVVSLSSTITLSILCCSLSVVIPALCALCCTVCNSVPPAI